MDAEESSSSKSEEFDANIDTHIQEAQSSIILINSKGELSILNANDQNELTDEDTIIEEDNDQNEFTVEDTTIEEEMEEEDDDLANLLISWKLYDELYMFLKEKKINIEGLKCMKERHIDQIFSQFDDFNIKMIFETKLGIWQNANGIFTVSPRPENKLTKQLSVETWINTLSSPSPTSNSSDCDITVLEILKTTEQGRAILEYYSSNSSLTPEYRTNLVHKIVQYFTDDKKKMTVNRCEILAEEIIKLFPKENLSSYFVRGANKIPPKGKLYDRYRGQRRSLTQLYKNDSKSSKKLKLLDVMNEDCNIEPINDVGMQKICDELKQNRNWDTVVKLWMQTMPFRRNMIDQSSDTDIQTVLLEWPLYKYSRAPELIAMDYHYIKPNNGFDYTKWQKFCNIAIQLFSERIKFNALKSYLCEFKMKIAELDNDNLNIAYMTLLHGVLTPSSKLFNGKLKKFTIEDFQIFVHARSGKCQPNRTSPSKKTGRMRKIEYETSTDHYFSW